MNTDQLMNLLVTITLIEMMVAIGLTLAAVFWIQFSHKALPAYGGRPSAETQSTADGRAPTTSLVRPTEAA